MTCLSCEHYRAAICGEPAWCAKQRPGFPQIGAMCRWFEYEPGADKEEARE